MELTAQMLRFEPRRLLEVRWVQIQQRKSQLGRIESEMSMLIGERLHTSREAWMRASSGVTRYDLHGNLQLRLAAVHERKTGLKDRMGRIFTERRHRVEHYQSLLDERSPLTVLNRGYSITRNAENKIVRDAGQVEVGNELSIRLARGELGHG